MALTANAMASDRDASFDAGMDRFVSKPVAAGPLVAAIKACDMWTWRWPAEGRVAGGSVRRRH